MVNSFFYKEVSSSELLTDKYIHVNNFGYYQDIMNINIRRERGRMDYQLIYLKKGELIVGQGEERCVLTDGSICLFRPKEAQIYGVNNVKTTYYWIHFSGKEVESMLSFFRERSYYVGTLPEFEYYCHGPFEELILASECAELLCEGRLIALIAKIAQRINTDTTKARNVKITRNMAIIRPALSAMQSDIQIRLTNEELSQLCHLSRSYFLKIFKDAMGVSPQQYYTTLIINKGCYLLANTSYNVSEISHLCGIEDGLYFSRLFKKHNGISPKNYRKKFMNV